MLPISPSSIELFSIFLYLFTLCLPFRDVPFFPSFLPLVHSLHVFSFSHSPSLSLSAQQRQRWAVRRAGTASAGGAFEGVAPSFISLCPDERQVPSSVCLKSTPSRRSGREQRNGRDPSSDGRGGWQLLKPYCGRTRGSSRGTVSAGSPLSNGPSSNILQSQEASAHSDMQMVTSA